MNRRERAGILTGIGVVLFLFSFFVLFQTSEFYLLSLVLMFIAVIMIGVGSAILKGFDRELDIPDEPCYYCQGTGESEEGQTCPRCGGTGLARPDDKAS